MMYGTLSQRISLTRAATAVRRNVWPLCVTALLLSNGVLIWKTQQMGRELSRAYQSISASGVHSLMMTPFQLEQGGTTTLAMSCRHYLALFVFARYDGPFYTDEAVSLNQVVRDRPDIAVFGLMAYGTQQEAAEFIHQQRLSYPVLADADGRILRGLDLPRTPWNVVFDCARRTLVYQGAPAVNGTEKHELLTKILSLGR